MGWRHPSQLGRHGRTLAHRTVPSYDEPRELGAAPAGSDQVGMACRCGTRRSCGRFSGRHSARPCRTALECGGATAGGGPPRKRFIQRQLSGRRRAAEVSLDDHLRRPDWSGGGGRLARGAPCRRRRSPVPALPPLQVRPERKHEADAAQRSIDRIRPDIRRGANTEEPGRRNPRPGARPTLAVLPIDVVNAADGWPVMQ